MSMTNQSAWTPKPPKPNRQIESMTKFHSGPYTVRVWRTAATLKEAEAHGEIVFSNAGWSMEDLAEMVAAMPNVAAVEVTDIDGNGVLIYPDWK